PGREGALGRVGRRGRDFFLRRGFDVRYQQVNLFARLQYDDAKAIAQAGMEAFLENQVDSVYLVYNEFKSVMVQRVVVERLLPIPRLDLQGPSDTHSDSQLAQGRPEGTAPAADYLYEPSPRDLLTTLIPSHVEVQVFRALLESNAAFYAAQMTAMDAATRNSGEMIESLTLYMSKVRQAA